MRSRGLYEENHNGNLHHLTRRDQFQLKALAPCGGASRTKTPRLGIRGYPPHGERRAAHGATGQRVTFSPEGFHM